MSSSARNGGRAPTISVAVSTYRRRHLLPRLVAALEAQTIGAGAIELVIVDDASGDGTSDVLRELAAATSLASMTVIVAERNGGPAVGRNAAWRASSGALVAFTDDDCEPTPAWLESAAAVAKAGGVAVGQTLPAPDQLAHEGAFSRTLRVTDARFMQTCNVVYPRGILEEMGGFEEALRTGEDTDLGLRTGEAGHQVDFVPDALVFHDVRPSDLRAKLRESRNWVDLPLVVRRHPQVRRSHLYRSLFWKKSHPPTIVAVLALPFAFLHPVALVLVAPWLWWRLLREPITTGRAERLYTLPGALLVDVTEVVTMVRGSLRHGALVL